MQIQVETIVIAGIAAVGNMGGIAIIAQYLAKKVINHDETLPKVSTILENTVATLAKTNEHLEELFNSRNEHENRIIELEMTHKMRGCDLPIHEKWRKATLRTDDES